MAERTVIVEINQQQAQMLDRLIADGNLGDDYGEVIRSGFVRFCREHPELGPGPPAGPGEEARRDG
jgi:hypothetical protein